MNCLIFQLNILKFVHELKHTVKNNAGGDIMTNINCTSNCIYQKDGKCNLNIVTAASVTANNSCIYFVKREDSKASSKCIDKDYLH